MRRRAWMGVFLRTLRLGARNIVLHGLRSFLTCMGVLFGVASVIAMLAIGEGLSADVQARIEKLGANNILIRAIKPPESSAASASASRISIYGITYEDAARIQETLPNVDVVVPVRAVFKDIRYHDQRAEGRIVGTVPWFPRTSDYKVESGRFLSHIDLLTHATVCVLGNRLAKHLFPLDEPIGKLVKLGTFAFEVVGVMEPRTSIVGDDSGALEDFGMDVYSPLTTMREFMGSVIVKVSSGSRDMEQVELHQLQVRVSELSKVEPTARILQEMMARFHDKKDYEVVVPLSLLREAEHNKKMFNIVLGSIAGISLLVGGIGITNVMLATVTERTREIGVRRALGAKRKHIILQFLIETVALAGSGGILGVLVGVTSPFLVQAFSKLVPIVTPSSLVLSFGISVGVGILFGLYPAWRAAQMDPVEALRHE